jgi:pantoate--beta-alanine ligase
VFTVTKIADLQDFLKAKRKQGINIGFVPTMGALHEGHLSLIARSRAECGLTVCSIFVNPTQFNDPLDLERYPKTPSEDHKMLKNAGCDVLFSPKVDEIYPKGQETDIKLGPVAEVLEGSFRPGHFKGVAQVVKRLFEIVEPQRAYFGSKDFQQVLVIRNLVKQMNSAIEVVACPIVREADGLAMSSRNTLLSSEERKVASNLPSILKEACRVAMKEGSEAARSYFIDAVKKHPPLKTEYFEICDKDTLKSIHGKVNDESVALFAVWLNKVRLIDNMMVSGDHEAAAGLHARSLNTL